MSTDEYFVGCLALAIACLATAISLGPWTAPYRIGSISQVESRFGKPAARLVWFTVAIVSAASGAAILAEARPGFATPAEHSEPPR